MKKTVAFLFLVLSVGVCAQTASKSGYKMGCKFGVASPTLIGGEKSQSSRIAVAGGVWCQLKMNQNWTAKAEIIHIEKGTGVFFNRSPRIGEYSVALMYIEFPILFQYHKKGFTFNAGPGLGLLTYQYESRYYGAATSNTATIYPFSPRELSFNIGCAYSLNEKWNLEVRYTNSLLPVRKQIPNVSKQIYNSVFAVNVARQIKFKKTKVKESELEG